MKENKFPRDNKRDINISTKTSTFAEKENKTAYIALGSNLGNREENLKTAIEKIKKIVQIKEISSIYETEPEGYKNQGLFLNMAIEIKTSLGPQELLSNLQEIENEMGRTREIKNGPRTIDLDIIFYEDKIIEEQNLKIPHPLMHKRNFVLLPMNEIAPEFIHPILKKSIKTLKNELTKN